MMKAITRVAHPKPILGCRRLKMIGKMMPPIGDPIPPIPTAKARLFWKYCAMMAAEGRKVRPIPMPIQNP